jgi:hypothetical protein
MRRALGPQPGRAPMNDTPWRAWQEPFLLRGEPPLQAPSEMLTLEECKTSEVRHDCAPATCGTAAI